MRSDYFRLAFLAVLFFIPLLGGVHLFDWGELNTAECSREMLLTGNFLQPQLGFKPFWETTPMFYWFQALSMKVFGVNEFAARFPNAVCGLFTLILVYHLGRRLHDRTFGWIWALAWLGSLMPHLYFRSGMIDPWFNLLIFLALYGFIEFRWQFFSHQTGQRFWTRYRHLLLGGGALGLAILTEGLLAYLVVFLVLMLYWARYRFKNRGFPKHLALFSLAAFAVSGGWFAVETYMHGWLFVTSFFKHQLALLTPSSDGFVGYQALLLLLGCFPVSVFAIPNLWGDRQTEDEVLESDTLLSCKRSDMATWMQLLFWVVLVVFSLAPARSAHFASLAYFPLTYLGALTMWRALHWEFQPKIVGRLLPALGLVIGLFAAATPMLAQNPQWLMPWFEQQATTLVRLHTELQWNWWHSLPGLTLAAASVAAWLFWQRKRAWLATQTAFAGGAVFVTFSLVFYIRNIEQYTQCPAIEFYESKAGQDCSVNPVGFESHAHFFYGQKKSADAASGSNADPALLSRKPGQKTYFVVKDDGSHQAPLPSGCRELYRKGGYVFYEQVSSQ